MKKVDNSTPIHPVDSLSLDRKNDIYYCRVVDLAVAQSLLTPDPETEIGHFAFSRHYYEGKKLDMELRHAIAEFEAEYPDVAARRRLEQDRVALGAVQELLNAAPDERIQELIRIGASYAVWPRGTAFTLTYPWDLAGNGRTVRFRDDLSDFMKKRIIDILKRAGKLRTPNLFGPTRVH
jgi:alkylhydroperoxidase/carboxymuconolactone decarboxylase family protein YurZ